MELQTFREASSSSMSTALQTLQDQNTFPNSITLSKIACLKPKIPAEKCRITILAPSKLKTTRKKVNIDWTSAYHPHLANSPKTGAPSTKTTRFSQIWEETWKMKKWINWNRVYDSVKKVKIWCKCSGMRKVVINKNNNWKYLYTKIGIWKAKMDTELNKIGNISPSYPVLLLLRRTHR